MNDRVVNIVIGMDFTEYNQGHILRIIKYDDSNPRHTGLMHQVALSCTYSFRTSVHSYLGVSES